MFPLLTALKGFLQDNQPFDPSPYVHKLHYLIVHGYFLMCLGILASSEYYGKQMSCFSTYKELPQHVIEDFCMAITTFVLGPSDEKDYISGYPWAMFIIYGIANLFYIPHLAFKKYVTDKLSKFFKGL